MAGGCGLQPAVRLHGPPSAAGHWQWRYADDRAGAQRHPPPERDFAGLERLDRGDPRFELLRRRLQPRESLGRCRGLGRDVFDEAMADRREPLGS